MSDATNGRAAAHSVRLKTHVLDVTAEGHVEAAFTVIVERRIDAALITADPFFVSQRDKLVALAARHAVPVIYFGREFVAAGGLINFGANENNAFRLAGVYGAKVLHRP